ncbi:response regulator, partial [Escherichia coli]|uniref:response regulator n=1 Tax=Escherichia coli TaxID=562 RepID=UPI003F44B973
LLQRSCGYETVEASNGREAVEKAISEKPDLIVMDLGLPIMSGIEAAKIIKESRSTKHIPIIAHTAWSAEQRRDEVQNAGMIEYLQ